jgi:hypothetical protein
MTGDRYGYDLAIVGSGGGAFAAARRRELSVVMIECGVVGGTCVNVGCIPSKALLAAAEARHRVGQRRFPGISTQAGPVDFAALIAGKREIVETLRQEKYIDLAAEYGFELLAGTARFVDRPALDVDGERIEAAHYLVATGSEPHIPNVQGLADTVYLTSTTAMELDELPESMLVIGGRLRRPRAGSAVRPPRHARDDARAIRARAAGRARDCGRHPRRVRRRGHRGPRGHHAHGAPPQRPRDRCYDRRLSGKSGGRSDRPARR